MALKKIHLNRQGLANSIIVGTDLIASGAIVATHLASGLIAATHIGSAVIAGTHIGSSTISATHLDFTPVTDSVLKYGDVADKTIGESVATFATTVKAGKHALYLNGVRLNPTSDYNVSGTDAFATLNGLGTAGFASGDELVGDYVVG